MALIRWNPWNLSSLLVDDWDFPTVPGVTRMLGQGLNLYETDDQVIAEVALPGISEDKVDVSIDDGIVRISASDEQVKEDAGQRKYFMSSMAQSYNYSFRLPDGITEDQDPQAVLRNGVLNLTFRKAQKVAPRKIKVISEGKTGSSQKQVAVETGSSSKTVQ